MIKYQGRLNWSPGCTYFTCSTPTSNIPLHTFPPVVAKELGCRGWRPFRQSWSWPGSRISAQGQKIYVYKREWAKLTPRRSASGRGLWHRDRTWCTSGGVRSVQRKPMKTTLPPYWRSWQHGKDCHSSLLLPPTRTTKDVSFVLTTLPSPPIDSLESTTHTSTARTASPRGGWKWCN